MHIMFITNFYSPDEINYCKGCDKTNRLQEEIFNLEEDMGIIKMSLKIIKTTDLRIGKI